MSGIYFHVPFCKVQCRYCDFYKTTDLAFTKKYVKAIKDEIWLRRDYLNDKGIETIYFGGGTPSLLSFSEIDELINTVYSTFNVQSNSEITLEANPDDLSLEYLGSLSKIGINRLSIGIQSFSDADLKLLGRRHNSEEAIRAVKNAQREGFNNISIDLIYGIPGMSLQKWRANLKTAFDLDIQHLSAYHLTYHKKTPFWDQKQKGIIHEVEEGESLHQYEELIHYAENNGFIQYEISNFASNDHFSRHNSAYWDQTEYLGLGPSAHSFNKKTRYWNVSDIRKYLLTLGEGKKSGGEEILTLNDRFNDYIITGLRTIKGIDNDYIKKEFGKKYFMHVEEITKKFISAANIEKEMNRIRITKKGIFISDKIISDFLFLNLNEYEY